MTIIQAKNGMKVHIVFHPVYVGDKLKTHVLVETGKHYANENLAIAAGREYLKNQTIQKTDEICILNTKR